MSFWRYHRRAARIARAMLAVWLFALGSSWVNACVLESRSGLHHDVHRGAALEVVPHSDAGALAATAVDEGLADHDGHGPRELCQSVCDDEQTTLPKVVAPSVPDLGPPGLVPTEPWSFCAAQAQFPRGCPLAAAPPPEAPVAIRFLRLTI